MSALATRRFSVPDQALFAPVHLLLHKVCIDSPPEYCSIVRAGASSISLSLLDRVQQKVYQWSLSDLHFSQLLIAGKLLNCFFSVVSILLSVLQNSSWQLPYQGLFVFELNPPVIFIKSQSLDIVLFYYTLILFSHHTNHQSSLDRLNCKDF